MRFFVKIAKYCYKILNKSILNNFHKDLVFKDQSFFRNREILMVPDVRTSIGELDLATITN